MRARSLTQGLSREQLPQDTENPRIEVEGPSVHESRSTGSPATGRTGGRAACAAPPRGDLSGRRVRLREQPVRSLPIRRSAVGRRKNPQIRQLFASSVLFPERELPVAGRPLVNVSFAINYALGRLDVRGYHVWNIATHLLCALLLFGIVRRTLELPAVRPRLGRWSADLAFAVALIWVVHPLNTEAVNYLTQRTESMMGLFYFLTLYASIRARMSAHASRWAVTSVVSCAAGMACKESMATAPLMIVLYDRVFLFDSLRQGLRERWRLYAGLAMTWLVLAALMLSGPRVHSAGFSSPIRPWTYLLNQAVMIVHYLRLAIWPRALVLNYGAPSPLTLHDVAPYAVLVVALFLVTVAALALRPKAGVSGAWFFVTLAPASSIVPIATEVGAERRMYLPLAGLIALAVVGCATAWTRIERRCGGRPASIRDG